MTIRQPEAQSLFFTKAEVATMFGVVPRTIYRRCKEGKFPMPVKVLGQTRWRRDEILAYVENADRGFGEMPHSLKGAAPDGE